MCLTGGPQEQPSLPIHSRLLQDREQHGFLLQAQGLDVHRRMPLSPGHTWPCSPFWLSVPVLPLLLCPDAACTDPGASQIRTDTPWADAQLSPATEADTEGPSPVPCTRYAFNNFLLSYKELGKNHEGDLESGRASLLGAGVWEPIGSSEQWASPGQRSLCLRTSTCTQSGINFRLHKTWIHPWSLCSSFTNSEACIFESRIPALGGIPKDYLVHPASR